MFMLLYDFLLLKVGGTYNLLPVKWKMAKVMETHVGILKSISYLCVGSFYKLQEASIC